MSSDFLQYFSVAPVFAVWMAGIILAVTYRQRHPQASALVLLACAIRIGVAVGDVVLARWLPQWLLERGSNVEELSRILAIKSFVTSLIVAFAWILVFVAIFQLTRASTRSCVGARSEGRSAG